jgi:FkbM family methyltransferase
MIIVSQLVALACRIGGPKFTHQVYLRQLQRWHTFEPEFYLLDRLIDPGCAAIDVGANEGIYAGRMSQLCSRVHCFEPIPWFAVALREKLKRSVVVHELALSNRTGTGALRVPYRDSVELHGTTTLEEQNPLPGATHVRSVECAVRLLDDCLDEPVGFIKIDVEGHELAVLEGAKNTLLTQRPMLLIESERRHNAQAPESIFNFMEELGYHGAFLKEGSIRPLAEFSREIDQSLDNVPDLYSDVAPEERRRKPYINNFIFGSEERISALIGPI